MSWVILFLLPLFSAKSIAENPVCHSRTKHIEVDVHFVREKVECGDVEVWHVPS